MTKLKLTDEQKEVFDALFKVYAEHPEWFQKPFIDIVDALKDKVVIFENDF